MIQVGVGEKNEEKKDFGIQERSSGNIITITTGPQSLDILIKILPFGEAQVYNKSLGQQDLCSLCAPGSLSKLFHLTAGRCGISIPI